MSRRRARLSAAETCARVSFAARAGSGALPSSSSASGASRSSKASSAAGKYSRSWCRSRCTCRVRSQISVLWVRATTLTAPASGLSPATARSWWESVRTMSVSMCASPRVALGAGHAVAFPVPRGLQRVHRVHRVPGRDQRGHPRAAVGLDPDHHLRIIRVLAQLLPDQLVQLGHPGHPLRQPPAGQHPARARPSAPRRDGPQPSHHPRTSRISSPVRNAESGQQPAGEPSAT